MVVMVVVMVEENTTEKSIRSCVRVISSSMEEDRNVRLRNKDLRESDKKSKKNKKTLVRDKRKTRTKRIKGKQK